MENIDTVIIEFINRFSQRSWTFDRIVSFIVDIDLLKGGVIIAVYWALWFSCNKGENVAETRRTILATYVGIGVALFLARVLAHILPFRFRPIHNHDLQFRLPFGVSRVDLEGWSSFPSDHATMFFGLSVGILMISQRIGCFSIIYVLLIILFPRIYSGYHYPTDIIFGSLLGVICVIAANMANVKRLIADPLLELSEKYPRYFYGSLFLISYESSNLFDHIRKMAKFFMELYRAFIHRI